MTDTTDKLPALPANRRPGKSLLVILAVSVLTIIVFVAVAEVYLRLTVPFVATNWPGRFDPRFGTKFKPGEVLQWTNGVDYWTRTQANTLGFLDREPPLDRAGSHCRVLFIGDSFVEAAQVPIDRKFHVVFERLAREQLPALDIETLAFGYSGTGQANQLAFYEFFGAPLKPDVVALVVSGNDFSNNSPILEGVRNGWHPLHLPRLFFAVSPDGGRVSRQAIDPDWKQYRSPDPVDATRPLHQYLHRHSYFYYRLFTHIRADLPELAARLSGWSKSGSVTERMRAIEQIEGYGKVFEQWNYPNDLDYDTMFFAEDPLPPVFEQALQLTGHALDEFQRHAHNDGFRLLLLAGNGLSPRYKPDTVTMGRTLRDRGGFRRLDALASARGIPLIDQYSFMVAQGGTKRDAHFSRDGHWSGQGHKWAAVAVLRVFPPEPAGLFRAGSERTGQSQFAGYVIKMNRNKGIQV